jgi:tetratricopeptide (TPR) repeat protein
MAEANLEVRRTLDVRVLALERSVPYQGTGSPENVEAAIRAAPRFLETTLSSFFPTIDRRTGVSRAMLRLRRNPSEIRAEDVHLLMFESIPSLPLRLVAAVRAEANRPASRLRTTEYLGDALHYYKEYGLADQAYKLLLSLARDSHDLRSHAHAYRGRGDCALRLGNLDIAASRYARAMKLYDALHLPRSVARVHRSVGIVEARRGRFKSARRHLRLALAFVASHGHEWEQAKILQEAGWLELDCRSFTSSLASFSEALRIYTRIGRQRGKISCLLGLSRLRRPSLAYATPLDLRLACQAIGHEPQTYRRLSSSHANRAAPV